MNMFRESLAHGYKLIRFLRKHVYPNKGFLRVLIYHDIAPWQEIQFSKQIQALLQYYRIIDIDTFCKMHQGKLPIQGGNILLTFDDGLKSNRYIAENVLNSLGIKALFFIIPEFMKCVDTNQQKMFIANNLFNGMIHAHDVPTHLLPMDSNDIQYLINTGHAIGSHSSTHTKLTTLNASALTKEIIESADRLQQQFNIPIHYFAYPFGDINSINMQSLQLAKQRYRYVFSGVRGNNSTVTHPFAVRREHVDVGCSLKMLYFIVEGGLSLYYYYKRKKLDNMVYS